MVSNRAEFRLKIYTLFRENKKVVFVSPYDKKELVAPVPSDVENPNTYLIPSDKQDSELISIESDTITSDSEREVQELRFDWYSLHSHVEELYESGWKFYGIE